MITALFIIFTVIVEIVQIGILGYNLSEDNFTSKRQINRLLVPWYGIYKYMTDMVEANGADKLEQAAYVAEREFRKSSPAIIDEKKQEAREWAQRFMDNGVM